MSTILTCQRIEKCGTAIHCYACNQEMEDMFLIGMTAKDTKANVYCRSCAELLHDELTTVLYG